jgi:hypothetical protein
LITAGVEGATGNTTVVTSGSETGTSFVTGTVMLSWNGLTGAESSTIECGFTGSGVSGSRPQYFISSPSGMAQLTLVATINEGSTGILGCDVITDPASAAGDVYVKWTGGIGHSVNNSTGTPNNFTTPSVPT